MDGEIPAMALVVAHPDALYVLTRFSHRWTTRQVAVLFLFFAEQKDVPNIVPWIPTGTALHLRPVVDGEGKRNGRCGRNFGTITS